MKQSPIYISIGIALFAISWIGVGTQHLMYLKFVGTLVPAYMPFRVFWAGLTGGAMIMAGISFASRIKVALAASLLSIMMALFLLMIHPPLLLGTPQKLMTWTRFVQDIAITGAAMMLTERKGIAVIGKYFYALAIFVLGIGHFLHPAFITGRIPAYFPAFNVADLVVGVVMACAAIFIITNEYVAKAATILGVMLLMLTLLCNIRALVKNVYDPGIWTPFLLELAIIAGTFFIAAKPGEERVRELKRKD
ncbi:hypothetical protein HQ865_04595 [Mucilaginibacter mali]|uniref:DoxX family protein n=1 Tax=Mucilaginibacter mali TaxID=2740462 RepID=A0A7D4UNK5_9SPHI|nr:hypothetical protein [Mucilaginibacter mali]QKJ29060.1 hypothetical protein HQ865_04595 [Mucilaginibacter mali]